jgi:hypothetical protein
VHGLDDGAVQVGSRHEVIDDVGHDGAGTGERIAGLDSRELGAEVGEPGLEQSDEHVLLDADEVVDGGVAHAGGVGQAPRGQALEAIGLDETGGGVEDLAPSPLFPQLALALLDQTHIRV